MGSVLCALDEAILNFFKLDIEHLIRKLVDLVKVNEGAKILVNLFYPFSYSEEHKSNLSLFAKNTADGIPANKPFF